MRYIGSKTSCVQDIYKLVTDRVPSGSFCDPFGGIGTVGSFFKKNGYKVISGDILSFAHAFQVSRIVQSRMPNFLGLRKTHGFEGAVAVKDYLNGLKPIAGWLTKNYAERRGFFSIYNAQRIDACLECIGYWQQDKLITRNEHALLIASVVDSMDLVANTAGTYYSYLKTLYRKANNLFSFDFIMPVPGPKGCRAFRCEAEYLVRKNATDVLYIDPPYNKRSYARYYHLPETIALGLRPDVFGVSGMPNNTYPSSIFNSKRKAAEALQRIMKVADFRLLLFHYSDNGLISPPTVRSILKKYGAIEEFILLATGYTSKGGPRSVSHRVYVINNA